MLGHGRQLPRQLRLALDPGAPAHHRADRRPGHRGRPGRRPRPARRQVPRSRCWPTASSWTARTSRCRSPPADPVVVEVQPNPLPDATLRAQVYQDEATTNGAIDNSEDGLAGFQGHINDTLGEVTTDVYGNPLCTTYVGENAGLHHPGRLPRRRRRARREDRGWQVPQRLDRHARHPASGLQPLHDHGAAARRAGLDPDHHARGQPRLRQLGHGGLDRLRHRGHAGRRARAHPAVRLRQAQEHSGCRRLRARSPASSSGSSSTRPRRAATSTSSTA